MDNNKHGVSSIEQHIGNNKSNRFFKVLWLLSGAVTVFFVFSILVDCYGPDGPLRHFVKGLGDHYTVPYFTTVIISLFIFMLKIMDKAVKWAKKSKRYNEKSMYILFCVLLSPIGFFVGYMSAFLGAFNYDPCLETFTLFAVALGLGFFNEIVTVNKYNKWLRPIIVSIMLGIVLFGINLACNNWELRL
ncbi:hypothetical protein ACFL54_05470 [Planctomycetota bacterium]